jgi:membrane associated rhomboid family serine protease
MQSTEQSKPLFGADNNALVAIVSVNLVVAVTYAMTRMVYFLEGFPMAQFYDEVVHHFMLSPYYQEALEKPWTFFIYNWSHDDFWTLCGDMIWLTVFGSILQNQKANKHLFPIYLYSGILGAIAFISLGAGISFMSAELSIMAIATAALSLNPTYQLKLNDAGGIPVWIIFTVYFVIQVATHVSSTPVFFFILSVGGLVGVLYMYLLKKKIDLGNWMHVIVKKCNGFMAPKEAQ